MSSILLCLAVLLSLNQRDDFHAPRMNQIQVIGTHNSYHLEPPALVLDTLSTLDPRVKEWAYSHDSLDAQLEQGVRSFELDIHPYVSGFKVRHVPLVDDNSTCPEFMECLSTLYLWSLEHNEHVPVTILIEIKQAEALLAAEPLCNDPVQIVQRIEDEIRTIFPSDKLVTPSWVQGNAVSLRKKLELEGWPPLKHCLGKFAFILHDRGDLRDACASAGQNKVLFVNASPARSDGAFIVVDDPYNPEISALLKQNMIVRVRADSGLNVDRPDSIKRKEQALACGAQIVSTDFPPGKADPATGYCLSLGESTSARSNPVTGDFSVKTFLQTIIP